MARVAAAASSIDAWAVIGTNTWTPFAPLVFTAPSSPRSASAWRTRRAAAHGAPESVIGARRVEVEHEMRGVVESVGEPERRVVLDGPLVGEPQQRPTVVAERVGDGALRSRCPERDRGHPIRRVLRHVLLHERRLIAGRPDDGQRSVTQHGQQPIAHTIEVVDELPLGGAGTLVQRLIQVRQLDPIANFGDAATTAIAAAYDRRGDGRSNGSAPPPVRHADRG